MPASSAPARGTAPPRVGVPHPAPVPARADRDRHAAADPYAQGLEAQGPYAQGPDRHGPDGPEPHGHDPGVHAADGPDLYGRGPGGAGPDRQGADGPEAHGAGAGGFGGREAAAPWYGDLAGLYGRFAGLVGAEAAAEVAPGGGVEPADVEQAVWLRLLELPGPPAEPAAWLRAAVRREARDASRAPAHGVLRLGGPDSEPAARHAPAVEDLVLDAERRGTVLAAASRLPGRCPQIVAALLSRSDPTYREISRELGISQGSLGPVRSRCLECLRTLLNSRVGSPVGRGNAR